MDMEMNQKLLVSVALARIKPEGFDEWADCFEDALIKAAERGKFKLDYELNDVELSQVDNWILYVTQYYYYNKGLSIYYEAMQNRKTKKYNIVFKANWRYV